jgi:hypothetical protein
LSGAGLAAAAAAMLENGKRLPTAAVALSSVRRSKMLFRSILTKGMTSFLSMTPAARLLLHLQLEEPPPRT